LQNSIKELIAKQHSTRVAQGHAQGKVLRPKRDPELGLANI
jgi:hypothetical protein